MMKHRGVITGDLVVIKPEHYWFVTLTHDPGGQLANVDFASSLYVHNPTVGIVYTTVPFLIAIVSGHLVRVHKGSFVATLACDRSKKVIP